MRRRVWIVPILVLFSMLFSAGSAHSDLIYRGNGMVYDTELDITWLLDANYAMTSGRSEDGRLEWTWANKWVKNLNYGGYDDWRLPSFDAGVPLDGGEMAHMYYNNLNGVAYDGCDDFFVDGETGETIYIENLEGWYYWGPLTPQDWDTAAYCYHFGQGVPSTLNRYNNELYVWPVRDGDVSVVPLPASVFLFGSGILGLGALRRRC